MAMEIPSALTLTAECVRPCAQKNVREKGSMSGEPVSRVTKSRVHTCTVEQHWTAEAILNLNEISEDRKRIVSWSGVRPHSL